MNFWDFVLFLLACSLIVCSLIEAFARGWGKRPK